MTCTEAREAMLTAEPRELEGIGVTPLVAHLGECARCKAAAAHLRASLGALSVELTRSASRRARRVVLVAALPIAAGLVAIVAFRGREREVQLPPVRPADVVSVQVAPGQQATVFKTKDPKVTVVWLNSEGGAP